MTRDEWEMAGWTALSFACLIGAVALMWIWPQGVRGELLGVLIFAVVGIGTVSSLAAMRILR